VNDQANDGTGSVPEDVVDIRSVRDIAVVLVIAVAHGRSARGWPGRFGGVAE
jgi:hypothetical protein